MRLRKGKRQKADDRAGVDHRPEVPAATPGLAVELRGVQRRYGRGAGTVHALAGIDLALPRGTFTAVMGPSGSGKSTFLQCAAGLDRPSAGSVRLGGTEITGMNENELTELRRSRLGFVFRGVRPCAHAPERSPVPPNGPSRSRTTTTSSTSLTPTSEPTCKRPEERRRGRPPC